jgi:CheY-like chemotaxis protein
VQEVARHGKGPPDPPIVCCCPSTPLSWVNNTNESVTLRYWGRSATTIDGPAIAKVDHSKAVGDLQIGRVCGVLNNCLAIMLVAWVASVLPQTGQSIQTMTASEPGLKETILLVDDEQSVRTIVLKILRRARYNVLEAENGEAALRIAEEHPGKIDLVITDMYMPGLRGREVVERLAPTRPGLRALFISGYADQDARTGVPGGANFLNKPFSGQELANAVEKVLKGPPL